MDGVHRARGWVTLDGVVDGCRDVRATWTNLVATEQIRVGRQPLPVSGDIALRASRYPEFRYGDRLRASGLLRAPPELEGFSYRDYLARAAASLPLSGQSPKSSS